MATRQSIFDQINDEREYQDLKWGGATVDDLKNGPAHWVAFITVYLGRAIRADRWEVPGRFMPLDFRVGMLKVAALAVAAIEWCDRQKA